MSIENERVLDFFGGLHRAGINTVRFDPSMVRHTYKGFAVDLSGIAEKWRLPSEKEHSA